VAWQITKTVVNKPLNPSPYGTMSFGQMAKERNKDYIAGMPFSKRCAAVFE